jgi:hypothetical protein
MITYPPFTVDGIVYDHNIAAHGEFGNPDLDGNYCATQPMVSIKGDHEFAPDCILCDGTFTGWGGFAWSATIFEAQWGWAWE